MSKIKEIPPEHKCSRCKHDLRKSEGGCFCLRSHPIASSKSGNNIIVTQLEYEGKDFPRGVH